MHIGEVDAHTKKQIALDMQRAVNNGGLKPVVEMWAKRTGRSTKTIYRYGRDYGFTSKRKKRKDAFQVSPELEKHLTNILYIYHRKSRENGSESGMPFETAVEKYQNHMRSLAGSEVELPSISWMQQIVRRWQASRKFAKEPTSNIQLRSLYPNHVHQLDFSICRYYMDPNKKIVYLKKSQDYKNKVGDYSKKRRLVRMVLIDHATGAFFVQYYFKQRTIEIAEFLYHAWRNKSDDYIFHGAPELLIIDNDKALHSHMMMRLFKYLDIEIPEVEPEAPRVKGSVEGFMRIWENWFEMNFLFEKSASLEEINKWAYQEAIRIQQKKVHRRHKMTRFEAWDKYIEDHLRELPPYEIYQQMLYSEAETRKIGKNGKLSYKGKEYTISDKELHGWKVDVRIHPYLYNESKIITVQFPPEGVSKENIPFMNVKTLTVAPDVDGAFGFSNTAVTWGDYAEKKGKTQSEKTFDRIAEAEISAHEIKPFSDAQPYESGKYPTRMGETIKASPDIQTGPVPMTKFSGKKYLYQLLGRFLTGPDIAAFNDRFKERTIFEADVEALAAEIQEQEKQIKEA